MGLDLYAFEMLSGRKLTPLPHTKASWSLVTNADESVTCTIPTRDPSVRMLNLWASTTLARNGLLAVVDDEPVAAGPIWRRRYSSKTGHLSLTAGGLRSYWNKRVLLPVAARATPLVNLATGDPDTSLDFTASGLEYGTIAKRYMQLVMAWPGGAVPVRFPADRVGTREKTVAAIDLKQVGKLIDDLSNLEKGPDFAFRPRWASDGLGIYWEFQHGTDAAPRLGSTDAANTKWTIGAAGGSAFDLEVDEDASDMASQFWVAGGGSSDKVVVARAESYVLPSAGFPLLEGLDTGRSELKLQATAQNYAEQGVNLGRYAASFWSMKVRAHEKGAPVLGDYWLGDMATVTIDRTEPVFPPGDYQRRIASISGDEKNKAYSVVFAEAVI